MPKKIDYTLTEEQIDKIEHAMKHDPRAEVVRRASAIYLLHQGDVPEGVAKKVSASKASVQNWYKRWLKDGIEGLANKPIPGRKPKANQSYREALEASLATDPHQLGYAFSVWTVDRLSQHLEQETGIRLSTGRLADWMSRWGYVYRRPKQDLSHKQDVDVREQVQAWLDELKKEPKTGIVSSSLWTKAPSA